MNKRILSFTALAAVAALTLGMKPQSSGPVKEGEAVDYTFRTEVVNGMGVQTLAALRGKPVLVEFWGTR